MRSAAAALAYSKLHPTIPYNTVSSIDGGVREVGDLECARSVMADFDVMPISDMGSANQMWARTVDQRTSGTIPNGAPLYFPNPRAGSSGHVAEWDAASGMAWTTPIWGPGLPTKEPYQGKHLVTIPELARLCGNRYAGWGADIAGMPINFTSTAGGGGIPITEQRRSPDMGVMYYRTDTGKRDGKPVEWALAGTCPGTPSNWQNTTDATTANQLVASGAGGSSVFAGETWWAQLKRDYLAAPATGSSGNSAELIDYSKLADAFMAAHKRLVGTTTFK